MLRRQRQLHWSAGSAGCSLQQPQRELQLPSTTSRPAAGAPPNVQLVQRRARGVKTVTLKLQRCGDKNAQAATPVSTAAAFVQQLSRLLLAAITARITAPACNFPTGSKMSSSGRWRLGLGSRLHGVLPCVRAGSTAFIVAVGQCVACVMYGCWCVFIIIGPCSISAAVSHMIVMCRSISTRRQGRLRGGCARTIVACVLWSKLSPVYACVRHGCCCARLCRDAVWSFRGWRWTCFTVSLNAHMQPKITAMECFRARQDEQACGRAGAERRVHSLCQEGAKDASLSRGTVAPGAAAAAAVAGTAFVARHVASAAVGLLYPLWFWQVLAGRSVRRQEYWPCFTGVSFYEAMLMCVCARAASCIVQSRGKTVLGCAMLAATGLNQLHLSGLALRCERLGLRRGRRLLLEGTTA